MLPVSGKKRISVSVMSQLAAILKCCCHWNFVCQAILPRRATLCLLSNWISFCLEIPKATLCSPCITRQYFVFLPIRCSLLMPTCFCCFRATLCRPLGQWQSRNTGMAY
jgi:hypothetical protein